MDVVGSSYAQWSILLVLGVPFSIIVLNELSDRMKRRSSIYLTSLEFTRDIVLPVMVLLIVLRLVFTVDAGNVPTKIVSTFFWIVLIVGILRWSQAFLGNGEYKTTDWRSKIPSLFLRLPTYTFVGVIVFHVIQNLWALPIREMATTLGIGSIVIAFALQDTLSNLVSGLLLVANSPFKTGDWVKVGDVEGKILSVNWRYTDIETWNGDLVVIPNGSISGESIENYSRPTKLTAVTDTVQIDFNAPPNDVKRVLLRTMRKTPGVLSEPEPSVALLKLQNPASDYEFEFWIDDYEAKPDILQDFLTRLWYATRRNNLSIPIPSQEFYAHKGNLLKIDAREDQGEIERILGDLPTFSQLSDELRTLICEDGLIKRFAATERILDIGEIEEGVFILASGLVTLEREDARGEPRVVERLKPGAIFGETGLFHRAISTLNAISQTDSELLILPHATFNQLLNSNAKLSAEIDALIKLRSVTRKGTASKAPSALQDREAQPAPRKVQNVD